MGSNTHTAAGIIEMYTNQFTQANGDRPNVENIAIIVTDGVSTTNNACIVPEAINTRSRGIRIFSVGITTSVNEQELREMSSMPQIEGQTYWQSSDLQHREMSLTRLFRRHVVHLPQHLHLLLHLVMGFAFCFNIFAFEIYLLHVVYSCGLINGNYAQIFYFLFANFSTSS